MDIYGSSAPDFFRIDDLFDFSNDDLFSTTTTDSDSLHHLPPLEKPYTNRPSLPSGDHETTTPNRSSHFPDYLCVPSDDVAELEWLSNFVDHSLNDFPTNELVETTNLRSDSSVPGWARRKRSKAGLTHNRWTSLPESDTPATGKSKAISKNNPKKKGSSPGLFVTADDQSSSSSSPTRARKCMHCASEKTPQWRTGPMGPKTLCNACGVRYKSGRLVPEYRPVASPTFLLSQHSNSHRKVMELRRQKETLREDSNNQHPHQFYHHPHDS